MSVLIKKFNPLEMSEEEVLALATGREKLLNSMLNEMRQCLKKGYNQHYVLYGPRGIGKSFFTRLLKIHHDRSEDFKQSKFIQLPEEQENINHVADLLDVISIILEGGSLADAKPRWTISSGQWHASIKRLRAAIESVKENKGIQHVFITQENLQVFIPKLDKIESSRLREFFSDFDEITLIGSSLRPDLDNDYAKRLFQVFKKFDIEPWKPDEFLSYYEKIAKLSNNESEQLDLIKKSKNKIKAISRFTGGSPRLAVILSSLILDKNILDTAKLLDGIIDDLTSYYQDITNDIPPKSKILFDMLIRKGENMTQSNLAASFEPPLDQSTIARSFSWLLDNYYVVFAKQGKGNTKNFYVRDRLYVLYYQKRQIYADVPYSFIGVFVDFLTEFYTLNERQEEIKKLPLDHPYCKPLLYHLAKKENLDINDDFDSVQIQNLILDKYANPQHFKSDKNLLIDSDPEYSELIKQFEIINNLIKKGEFEKSISHYENIIKNAPDSIVMLLKLSVSYSKIGNYKKAIEHAQLALNKDPDRFESIVCLGAIYIKLNSIDKAIAVFLKAKEINNKVAIPFSALGILYSMKGEFDKAKDNLLYAIKIEPNDELSHINLGVLYEKIGEINNAINSYLNAIFINPKNIDAYCNLGVLYESINEFDKSSEILNKALKLNQNDKFINNALGCLYYKKGDFSKSKKFIEKVLKIDSNFETAYGNLGLINYLSKDYKASIKAYEKAISLNLKEPDYYNNLGASYYMNGELNKSFLAYQSSMMLKPDEKTYFFNSLKLVFGIEVWDYLEIIKSLWKGDESISKIIGSALAEFIRENEDKKFFFFKNTIESIKDFSFINLYDVINVFCLSLYNQGDMKFLSQVVEELEQESFDGDVMELIIQTFKYLLNPELYDINKLHPDVRTVVESVLESKK